MAIDIYIRERNGSREIRVPWLPESIKFKSGGTVRASYDIMNKGPVEVHTGSGLCAYSWESEFPGKNRTDKTLMRGSWKSPETYHNILEDWKAKGTPLHLLATGYPINKDVLLDDYEAEATGAFGDIYYQVSFIEDRDITISKSTVASASSTGSSKSTKRSTTTPTSYTIKSGDTLWAIAEKYLGSGARWKEIYNANKEIIESTATARWKAAGINRDSQNGHWIFPGTVIKIPGANATTSSGSGGSGSSSNTKTAQEKKCTISVKNTGVRTYYGTYRVYVNGVYKATGRNGYDYSLKVNEGDTVKIVAEGKDGHGYTMSNQTYKASSDTTTTIKWQR